LKEKIKALKNLIHHNHQQQLETSHLENFAWVQLFLGKRQYDSTNALIWGETRLGRLRLWGDQD